MRENRRERMSVSSSYIGAGSLTSVFARRPRIPFVRIKQIYGDELERFKLEKDKNKASTELSEKEKKEIKTLVKRIVNRNKKREIITGTIAVIITLGLIYLFISFL